MKLYADEDVIARFTIDGEPVSKARARFTSYGSKTRTYTPEKTKEAEAQIAWAFLVAARGHKIDPTATYGVAAEFHYVKRQRRDVDNMLKLVCDGLNTVAWADDNQVTEVFGRKSVVAGNPHTTVVIYRTEPPPARTTPCEFCGAAIEVFFSRVRRFCSQQCHNASRRTRSQETRPCAHCGSPFEVRRNSTFCSMECRTAEHVVTLACACCGEDFTKPRSWANNGLPFCKPVCRASYWRIHRAVAARGTCSQCGGSTSKKSYTRCRSCQWGRVPA